MVAAAEAAGDRGLALLMETICSTSVRVSEVRYITVEAAKNGKTEIALKGKIRTILLPSKLCHKLLKFAAQQKTASGAIFRTKSGRPMSRYQIWSKMKKLCARAGVDAGKVFPHNLRHLFATAFYRAYKDIVKLADVLVHSSIETTRIYADAVNWAVANNVTNGTSATTSSPNADCTRAEIVTFLYRAYQGK